MRVSICNSPCGGARKSAIAALNYKEEVAGLEYRFHGGPFDGVRHSPRMLGEWVVFFMDENRQPTNEERALILVAYQQESNAGENCYRFKGCLTRDLQKCLLDFADEPLRDAEPRQAA